MRENSCEWRVARKEWPVKLIRREITPHAPRYWPRIWFVRLSLGRWAFPEVTDPYDDVGELFRATIAHQTVPEEPVP